MKSDEHIKFYLSSAKINVLAESRELNERTINLADTIQMLSELFQTRTHFANFNKKQPKVAVIDLYCVTVGAKQLVLDHRVLTKCYFVARKHLELSKK